MPGFLTRNWRLKLLALVLAIVAWAGVVLATNPPGTRSVSVPVPQPPAPDVSLPAGYLLTAPIPNLTVYITGTEQHLDAFSRSSLQVTVDYNAIRAIGRPGARHRQAAGEDHQLGPQHRPRRPTDLGDGGGRHLGEQPARRSRWR